VLQAVPRIYWITTSVTRNVMLVLVIMITLYALEVAHAPPESIVMVPTAQPAYTLATPARPLPPVTPVELPPAETSYTFRMAHVYRPVMKATSVMVLCVRSVIQRVKPVLVMLIPVLAVRLLRTSCTTVLV